MMNQNEERRPGSGAANPESKTVAGGVDRSHRTKDIGIIVETAGVIEQARLLADPSALQPEKERALERIESAVCQSVALMLEGVNS